MNIAVLSQPDLASYCALHRLLPRLAASHRLRVFLSDPHAAYARAPAPLRELLEFERAALENLAGFASLARHCEQAPATLNRINSEDGLATLAESDLDLAISIRYGGILRERAIAVPRFGVVNLHSGLLPWYRGVMASFRALLAGEAELGTTLHYITDPGIDTGPVIGTTRLPVSPGRSYLWHVLQLYPAGCDLILETVSAIASGRAPAGEAQPEGGRYFGFPDERDYSAFAKAGWTLFQKGEPLPLPC